MTATNMTRDELAAELESTTKALVALREAADEVVSVINTSDTTRVFDELMDKLHAAIEAATSDDYFAGDWS